MKAEAKTLGLPLPDLNSGLAQRPAQVVVRRYRPRGAALQLLKTKAGEVLVAGPAGTGKSRACLEKGNALAAKYPGSAGLILRKWKNALTSTALKTFDNHVIKDQLQYGVVKFERATSHRPDQYAYCNGSTIAIGGMDDPSKIMSSEYDWIYVQEATELTEDDWMAAISRLRNGVIPGYQQLLADCNPDKPTHWLNARCSKGKTVMLYGKHTDNPLYYKTAPDDLPDDECDELVNVIDKDGEEYAIGYVLTERGRDYIHNKLGALSGVRRKRLLEGKWVAAEGLVYEAFDQQHHVVKKPKAPPAEWPRYWVIDFGYTNPFVCQWWAEDPDGRLYRYREIYMSRKLVEDHAKDMLDCVTKADGVTWKEPKPTAIICDHDAEGRATLEKYLGLPTVAAKKDVIAGVQAVEARLKIQADGKPRMMFVAGALVRRDPLLDEAKKPCCTEEEFPGYVWPKGKAPGKDKNQDENPVKEDDHGLDTTRYMAAFKDLQGTFNIAYYPD